MRPLLTLIVAVFLIVEGCDSSTKGPDLPAIISINPPRATFGESVTISGNFLNAVDKVFFGSSYSVVPASASENVVTAIVPKMPAGPIEIWVQSPDGKSGNLSFEILKSVSTITSVVPAKAKRGEAIIISGENLDLITAVRFNNDSSSAASFTLENGSLKVVVPQDAVTGTIWISNSEGRSSSPDLFTVLIEPEVTSLSSSLGVENKVIEIRGKYFEGASVYFESELVDIISNNGSVLQVECPKFAQVKDIEIIVETAGGRAKVPFTGAPAATISKAIPGGFISGSALTLKGNYFFDVQSVILGEGQSIDQAEFIFSRPNEITFKVPAGTTSLALRIINQYGVGEIMNLDPVSSGNPLTADNIASSVNEMMLSSISNSLCSDYYIVFCSELLCFNFFFGDCDEKDLGIGRNEEIGGKNFIVFSAKDRSRDLKLEKNIDGTYTGLAIIRNGNYTYIGNKIDNSLKYIFYSTVDGSQLDLCNKKDLYGSCLAGEPCECIN